MSVDLLEALARAMLAATAAIVVVMLARVPVRRAFGAQPAYALWLLAPAATLASFVPVRTRVVAGLETASRSDAADSLIDGVAASAATAPAEAHASTFAAADLWDRVTETAASLSPALLGAWAAGVLVALAILVLSQHRFIGHLGLRPLDRTARLYRARSRDVGPALVGVLRPRIVVPDDFDDRFGPRERDLILAHERAHLAAFDPQINGLAAAALCLGWFNPLFHVARRFFRIDQELACDERVMRRHGGERRIYAEAMLKTQASRPIPLGCAWPPLGESSIRQRIAMLARPRLSDTRRALGAPLCAVLMLAACVATSAAQPPRLVVDDAPDPARRVQMWRQLAQALDPALCTRTNIFACDGSENAIGDSPNTDEAARLGMRLVLALQNGDIEPARRLIEAGADVDFYIPGDGTPLVIAAQKRDYAIARLLLDAGADVNRFAPGDGNPLINAARRGDYAMAELLVEHGADVNAVAPGDETPLINAARNNQTSVARYLIAQGADVNLAVDARIMFGETERRSPLSEAERRRHTEMVRLLREHGARS